MLVDVLPAARRTNQFKTDNRQLTTGQFSSHFQLIGCPLSVSHLKMRCLDYPHVMQFMAGRLARSS